MDNSVIDLRSDTVTRPSAAMREAMLAAPVGDDVFGEDPTINELEALAAELMGHEAALFVPSGSMANLIAQLVHTRRGDEVIIGEDSHCLLHEVGAGAALAGVQYDVVAGSPLISAEKVAERIKVPSFHTPGTGLVWIENTHNMGGGLVYPLEEVRRIAALCRERGLPLHIDGARVFNAACALGVPPRDIAALGDSVSFCLSKGLGAPVGSVLCGSREFRVKAHRFRKMLGGGMRQAGILAAAGIFALRHNVARLAEDHALARRAAEGLRGSDGIDLDPASVVTNIVIGRVTCGPAERIEQRCAARGVLVLALEGNRLRLVTHLDVDRAGVDRAVAVIREELGRRAS
ncbi:MAG: low-specificity L-threonine aldolase [Acidobacteria bacterium]|nr:low-specificity L-threonine aldolase [Acidobacteriota bacterium]